MKTFGDDFDVYSLLLVRGYQTAPPSLQGNLMGANLDQDAIRELSVRKQNLMMELNNYAENQKTAIAEKSGRERLSNNLDVKILNAASKSQHFK